MVSLYKIQCLIKQLIIHIKNLLTFFKKPIDLEKTNSIIVYTT
jgi:hypothetical protein